MISLTSFNDFCQMAIDYSYKFHNPEESKEWREFYIKMRNILLEESILAEDED